MRLTTKKRLPLYQFMNNCVMVFIICSITAFIFDYFQGKIFGYTSYFLVAISLMLSFIMYIRARQVFDYDSDGESLTLNNDSLLPALFRKRFHEFPKHKLISYHILNVMIYKRLYLVINHRKKNSVTLKYDISSLSAKETADLRRSLNKITINNQENNALKS